MKLIPLNLGFAQKHKKDKTTAATINLNDPTQLSQTVWLCSALLPQRWLNSQRCSLIKLASHWVPSTGCLIWYLGHQAGVYFGGGFSRPSEAGARHCVMRHGRISTLRHLAVSRAVPLSPPNTCVCLKVATVPSAQSLRLLDFTFSDFELSDTETTLATVRMFIDLNLVQNFQMKYTVGSHLPWLLLFYYIYRYIQQ